MKTFYPYVSRRVHHPKYELGANSAVPVPRGEKSVQLMIRNVGANAFEVTYQPNAVFGEGILVQANEVWVEDYDGPVWLIRDPDLLAEAIVIEGF